MSQSEASYESTPSVGDFQDSTHRGRDPRPRIITASHCMQVYTKFVRADAVRVKRVEESDSDALLKQGGFSKPPDMLQGMPSKLMRFDGAVETWLEQLCLPPGIARGTTEIMQYERVNDAARLGGMPEKLKSVLQDGNGLASIWYFNIDFLERIWPLFLQGETPGPMTWRRTLLDIGRNIETTHVRLGRVHCPVEKRGRARTQWLENLFAALQFPVWSPRGECSKMVHDRGLSHASMAIGDAVVIGTQIYVVARDGFLEIEDCEALLPVGCEELPGPEDGRFVDEPDEEDDEDEVELLEQPAKGSKKDKKDKKSKDDDAAGAADEDPDKFFVSPAKEADLLWHGVGPDEYAWQMMHMGPYMARSVGNAPDPKSRVKFKPDSWQKDLLDIVDDRESALIVAPTASGKTFIGYYAMDKVLREGHEGICVYVAPSPALVRQVSAEIFARFQHKTYPPHSQNQLFGVFLRNQNFAGGVYEEGKWRHCQVLVTVPHIFEMLLLNTREADWVKRLRWVIFDECHCIGDRGDGTQWERIMQLIPCPFIALSATVADESHYHEWLNAVAKTKQHPKVNLVKHTERWNDLYKHIFARGQLRPLHPFCCLLEQGVLKAGLSADLSLTPQEMVQLFQEVQRVLGKHADWDKLKPKDFFESRSATVEIGVDADGKPETQPKSNDFVFIKKNAAIQYSKVLKTSFVKILKDGGFSGGKFGELVMALQQPGPLAGLDPAFAPPPRVEVADATAAAPEESAAAAAPPPADLTKLTKSNGYMQADSLFQLFKLLDANDILPAIIFNFSRLELEKMRKSIVTKLKDMQHAKYYGDEDAMRRTEDIMRKRWADYEAKKKAFQEAQKANESKKQEAQAARKSGAGEGRGNNNIEAVDVSADLAMAEPQEPTDIADEIDPEFTFHSQKVLGQYQEDIDDIINELKHKKIDKELIEALRRGIGIHHEGSKQAYKQAVETLFRRGYLRVVFATATLALGINMPCRSTIFCGDSLELNGLMFRQMSGRAGRRGFDLLGQVIFWDMAFPKVQRLVASEMPSLAGEFKQSPSLVLRVLQEAEQREILQQADAGQSKRQVVLRDKEDVEKCISPMFRHPFFRSATALLEKQVVTFSRFATELHIREQMLTKGAMTRNLSGMVTHLFEVEPANMILNRIISKGLLHRYLTEQAQDVMKGDKKTLLTVKLAGVLGWFVYRQRLPERPGKYVPVRRRHLPSQDCPELPPLPDYILEEVEDYNKNVFELFQQMAFSVASSKKLDESDLTLPFTKRSFPLTFDPRGDPAKGSKFFDDYKGQLVKPRSRSPFSAMAGFADFFRSPADLATSTRHVLHMDISQLPMVPPPPGCEQGQGLEPANSWVVDILIHEQLKYLTEDNGLGPTEAYKLIESFREFTEMAKYAIQEMVSAKDDILLTTLDQLSKDLKACQKKK
mmetsp:Transcript_70413/g.168645  ORF Transcript_70413/g.168645 Transcript_70413/m.168645 type:complete len:1423 (-) Transcript_70413:98-4366(-)